MQLPTSVAAQPFVSPNPNRPASAPIANQSAVKETTNVRVDRPERAPQQSSESRSQSSQVNDLTSSERVVAPQQSEVPTQDLAPRERQAQSTGNAVTDQYQQIARQGAQDAQAQDPSLFRIDVYV